MSNIAGKAYAMNVMTPVPPAMTWLQRLLFMVSRAFPTFLSGLLGLSIIHFARWVLIKRDQWPAGPSGKPQLDYDYMLFCSNFNGTWDQYIDAFADGIPGGLDLFWYTSVKYPASIPITSFKDYINHNQFHTGYYYNATPGSGQRDIKAALKVYAELKALEKTHAAAGMTAPSFAIEYRKSLAKIQNCLGSPGYAPIASLDTDRADKNRAAFVKAQAVKVAQKKAVAPGAALAASAPVAPPAMRTGPTTTFDSGRCFLTVLLPIKTDEIVNHDGQRSSPVHMVRDALSVLATAHQSPATLDLPDSPFSRCLKTHFVRMAVIEDTICNGRTASDAILDRSSPLIPRPVDQLPNPYLMFNIDFDAPDGAEAELRAYLRDMWTNMRLDLEPVFTQCFGYSNVNDANGFVNYIIACQIETTMPFNDYWADGLQPPPALPLWKMTAGFAATVIVTLGVLYGLLDLLGLIAGQDWDGGDLGKTILIILAAVVAGLGTFAYAVLPRMAKAVPMALNSNLPLIVKVLVTLVVLGGFMLAWGGIFYGLARLLHWVSDKGWPWLYGGEIVVILVVALLAGVYALYRLVMGQGMKPFLTAPNSDLKSVLKALYLQRQLITFAIRQQGADAPTLFSQFGTFLATVQLANLDSPTQRPGVIQ